MNKLSELIIFNGDIPLRENEKYSSRDALLKPSVNPFEIYFSLKNEFGLPTNDNFDEDKSQWSYLFTFEDFYVHIYDWRLYTTSIAVYHKEINIIKSEKLVKQIEICLLKSIKNNKAKIVEQIKKSKHRVIENPFYTYFSTAESIIEVSKTLNEQLSNKLNKSLEMIFKSKSGTINDIYIDDKSNDLCRSAFLMYLSSFEGFLNILYEIFLKPELRVKRISDRISKEQIDVKLKLIPLYCSGFKVKVINFEDERFDNYLKLINLRNNFVHANMVKTLEKYVLEEDNYKFIIENKEDDFIPTNFSLLELKHIVIVKETIKGIIDLVLESMTQKQMKTVKRVIYKDVIEVISYENYLTIK